MNRFIPCVVAFALVASAAQATPIAPGGSVPNPAGSPATFGTQIGLPLVSPFIVNVPNYLYSGTLTSTAYFGDPANPYGGVTFHFQLSNDAASLNALGRLSNNGFAGFQTDVTWLLGTGLPSPFAQDRSLGAGDVIGHNFGLFFGHTPINPGMTSVILVVHTDAPLVTVSFSSIIDGQTATVPSLAPIPTPGAAALMGMGLLASARRRRA